MTAARSPTEASDATTAQAASTEALYRQQFEFVWRNARRLGCGEDCVDDVVHEVFLVAARRLAEFEGRANLRTWLFAITLRVVARQRRDRARQLRQLERYQLERPPGAGDAEAESESAQLLRHLLLQLDEKQRVVVILAELEGFTSAEIATTLGIPAGTVDSRLRSARGLLLRLVERERAKQERWAR